MVKAPGERAVQCGCWWRPVWLRHGVGVGGVGKEEPGRGREGVH